MATGTPKKVTLDGTTFNVAADANFSEVGSKYLVENMPTSGPNIPKMTKRAQNVTDIPLIVDGAERAILKALSERTEAFPLSYELVSGDIYRATGHIEFESRNTDENRASVQLLPQGDWTPFLA
jgi:hypothetical protein